MGYKGIIVPYPLLTTSKVVEMRFCMREAAWMLGGGLGIGLGFKRGRNVVVSINGGPQHRSQHIIAVIMISKKASSQSFRIKPPSAFLHPRVVYTVQSSSHTDFKA